MHFWINLHLLGVQNYCIILLFNSRKFSDFLCDSLTHELLRLLNISFFSFLLFSYFTVVRDCGLHATDSLILIEHSFVSWLVYDLFSPLCLKWYILSNCWMQNSIYIINIMYIYLYTIFSSVLLLYCLYLLYPSNFLLLNLSISEWHVLKSPKMIMNLLIFLCNLINVYSLLF